MKTVYKYYKVSEAGKSLKITLPKEFIKIEGIKKGDTLEIIYVVDGPGRSLSVFKVL